MKVSNILLLAIGASALSIPEAILERESTSIDARAPKGGGGGGGKGGSGSSGGGSSGKGGSGDSGSSSSSSSGKGGSSSSGGKGLGSSSSSAGGRTTTGSGVTPRVGGFYGGGASVPYRSGQRSSSGISPVLIGAGVGFGFGALALHGSYYNYPYGHPFTFHNATTNSNQTKPVDCLCAADEECGCDDNSNATYIESLIGNGSYAGLNQTLVTVADINGSSHIVINGSLPNGTTAAGGTVSATGSGNAMQSGGYLAIVAFVGASIFLL